MTRRLVMPLALFVFLAAPVDLRAQAPDGPRAGTASASVNGVRRATRTRPVLLEPRRRGETIGEQLEACWRAEERGKDRIRDFDQRIGTFHATVRTRWCLTTIDVAGAVDGARGRIAFTGIDTLTIGFQTNTLDVRIRERAGHPTSVTANGRPAASAWWNSALRRRLLDLARLPLR